MRSGGTQPPFARDDFFTSSQQRAGRGFTLVELLLALTLTGLIMVALYSGLRVGTRASDAAETRAALT
ncbi:MAG: prepilin-type N-terminal cleavage/methylation domain-containing protein, partial [Gammaproteobacteria bacterium]